LRVISVTVLVALLQRVKRQLVRVWPARCEPGYQQQISFHFSICAFFIASLGRNTLIRFLLFVGPKIKDLNVRAATRC
jgi:hypothetical protein